MPTNFTLTIQPKEFAKIAEEGVFTNDFITINFTPEEQLMFKKMAEKEEKKEDAPSIIMESDMSFDLSQSITDEVIERDIKKIMITISEKTLQRPKSSHIAEYL